MNASLILLLNQLGCLPNTGFSLLGFRLAGNKFEDVPAMVKPQKFITDEQKIFFDQLLITSGCKDLNSEFTYANQVYAGLVSLVHNADLIDQTDFDIPCETVNYTELFRDQD